MTEIEQLPSVGGAMHPAIPLAVGMGLGWAQDQLTEDTSEEPPESEEEEEPSDPDEGGSSEDSGEGEGPDLGDQVDELRAELRELRGEGPADDQLDDLEERLVALARKVDGMEELSKDVGSLRSELVELRERVEEEEQDGSEEDGQDSSSEENEDSEPDSDEEDPK